MKVKLYSHLALFRHSTPSLLAFLMIILFIISCNKFKDDFDLSKIADPVWKPEFAIPLVNSTFTIKDFFEDSGNVFIKTNPDNSLSFIYGIDELFSQSAGELMKVPDQDFDFQDQVDVPPLLPGFFDTLQFDHNYQFITDTIGQRLDSIILKSGQMYIHGTTNLNRNVASIMVKVPDIINIASGAPLTIQASLNNPGGQQAWVDFEESFDLSEYKISFNDDANSPKNTITFLIEVIIHGDNNPDLSPYDFNIDGYLKNIEFHKAFGYFGQYNLSFIDSLDINMFDKTISGGIQLGPGAIDLYVDIRNSFGTPVMFAANEIYVESKHNAPYHVDINLFGSGMPNIFSVNAPDISQVGQTVETNLDFSNSNIGEAFNIAPEKFYFDFSAITNTQGDTTAENFLLDTSRISLDLDLEVKLFTSISNFVVEDTIDFDLDQQTDDISHLLIRLNATNRFPLNAYVQVYFTDGDYNVLDSLIDKPDKRILVGAPVSGPPEYSVTDSAHSITDFELSKARINSILKAEKLLLRAALSTTDGQLCIIYDDYSLKIKIGVIAGVNITNQ